MSFDNRPNLPKDYLDYIASGGVLCGFTDLDFGEYFDLEPLDSVKKLNQDIETDRFAPDLIAFASNGSGEAYAFDGEGVVYSLPLIGMSRDCAVQVAPSWTEFARHIRAS